jgi:hypothetical protein
VLGDVLRCGLEGEVVLALDALSKRTDQLTDAAPTLIRLLASPTGVIGESEKTGVPIALEETIPIPLPETNRIHQCATSILVQQGAPMVDQVGKALRENVRSLERRLTAARHPESARPAPTEVDAMRFLLDLNAFQAAWRRLSFVLRRLGDRGTQELTILEDLPVAEEIEPLWQEAIRNARLVEDGARND